MSPVIIGAWIFTRKNLIIMKDQISLGQLVTETCKLHILTISLHFFSGDCGVQTGLMAENILYVKQTCSPG